MFPTSDMCDGGGAPGVPGAPASVNLTVPLIGLGLVGAGVAAYLLLA